MRPHSAGLNLEATYEQSALSRYHSRRFFSAAPCLTDRLVRFGIHLNDIDREMTDLCRCARSVPIFRQMNADLPSLDQLRCNAAECIRLAEAARNSQHKSLFIEMADRWLTLAEHAAREDRLNGGSLFRDR